jgi:hypothetical protein
MRSLRAASVLWFSIAAGAAQAAVLHDQPLESWEAGWCSPCSGDLDEFDWRTFGSFSLVSDSILKSGTFAIFQNNPGSGDLNISIWDEPFGTELYALDVDDSSYTKVLNPNATRYYVVVELPNWSLDAGSYWISLFGINNNPLGWGTDSSFSDDKQYESDGSVNQPLAYVGFSLSGLEVPEPTVLTLLGLGMAGLVLFGRRRVAPSTDGNF